MMNNKDQEAEAWNDLQPNKVQHRVSKLNDQLESDDSFVPNLIWPHVSVFNSAMYKTESPICILLIQ